MTKVSTPSQVTLASRPALDAWFGARDWALENLPPREGAAAQGWISRQEYEEKGGEYLSEHRASNTFIPIKITKAAPARPTEPSAPTLPSAAPATMVTAAHATSSSDVLRVTS